MNPFSTTSLPTIKEVYGDTNATADYIMKLLFKKTHLHIIFGLT
jgi:hypothetical protein